MPLSNAYAFDRRTDHDSAAVNRKCRSIRQPNSGVSRAGAHSPPEQLGDVHVKDDGFINHLELGTSAEVRFRGVERAREEAKMPFGRGGDFFLNSSAPCPRQGFYEWLAK